MALLIPSIDLMGGKIVQLVQGRKKALEFDNFDEWIDRFSSFPLVQLIDLDAAIGTGDNGGLLEILPAGCRARSEAVFAQSNPQRSSRAGCKSRHSRLNLNKRGPGQYSIRFSFIQ